MFVCRVCSSSCGVIISPPSIQELFSNTNPSTMDLVPISIILPRVILWHPLLQYPHLTSILQLCPHEKCQLQLELQSWTIGQNSAKQPRLLHDTDGIILLVSALYRCSNDHLVYSTDARLMQKISTPYLPVVLLHRTGFTASFIKHVISLVQEGLSMSSIARHIQRVREQVASETVLNFISDYLLITHQQYSEEEMLVLTSKFESIVSPLIKPFPTNDVIAKCFLISFEMAETFYIREMLALKVRHCIRLDHTFKIASNIGYLRDDKKWITQYGTVFFVINEDGQVVT